MKSVKGDSDQWSVVSGWRIILRGMAKVKTYKDLVVWQKSMDMTAMLYQLVKKLPKEETYALSDQMRRAAISVPSNIAEGFGRSS